VTRAASSDRRFGGPPAKVDRRDAEPSAFSSRGSGDAERERREAGAQSAARRRGRAARGHGISPGMAIRRSAGLRRSASSLLRRTPTIRCQVATWVALYGLNPIIKGEMTRGPSPSENVEGVQRPPSAPVGTASIGAKAMEKAVVRLFGSTVPTTTPRPCHLVKMRSRSAAPRQAQRTRRTAFLAEQTGEGAHHEVHRCCSRIRDLKVQ